MQRKGSLENIYDLIAFKGDYGYGGELLQYSGFVTPTFLNHYLTELKITLTCLNQTAIVVYTPQYKIPKLAKYSSFKFVLS